MVRFLIYVLGKILYLLPEAFSRFLSAVIGDLIILPPSKRRRTVLRNLHGVYPDKTEAWRRNLARTSARRMVEMALFVLVSPHFSLEQLKRRFRLSPAFLEAIDHQNREPEAIIAAVPHFCMMEALTMIPGLAGNLQFTIGTIFRPLNQPVLDRWVKDTRERFGMKLLSRKDGFTQAIGILRQKGVVSILFDQNAGQHGILTTFFDRVVSSTELPGLLGARYKTRLVGIYSRRTGFWRAELDLHELPRQDNPSNIVFACNQWLEKLLLEEPVLQPDWLWLHNRWRHQDTPSLRFRLVSKRNQLKETLAYKGQTELPRKTRFWFRMPNWLGDVIMAIPLLLCFRQSRPDAEVTLLSQPHFIPLLQSLGLAERYIALPSKKEKGYYQKIRQLALEYPDVQYLFTNSWRGDLEAKLIGAPQRFGLERPGRRRPLLTHTWKCPRDLKEAEIHQTLLWEKAFRHFGMEGPLPRSPLSWPGNDRKKSDSGRRRIGLICGTENSPEKRWPVDSWRKLIDARPNDEFFLFGTIRDQAITSQVAKGVSTERVHDRAGKTGLVEFASELNSCDLVVGNDTGGMHLANMLGVPVVVIFGPTNSVRTGPFFEAPVELVSPPGTPPTGGGDITKVSVDAVLAAMDRIL